MKFINRHKKSGFTIVEVSLFLALSGFLMVGLIVGANISISRQRYNDSVNSVAEFFRGIYADVMNVSNDEALTSNPGRTTTAIYGKYISIGEKNGNDNEDGVVDGTIYVYDIAGHAVNSTISLSSSVIEALRSSDISANIFDSTGCATINNCTNKTYRTVTYNAPWEASLEKSDGSLFSGGIFVVRSPVTGGIRTYVYEGEVYDFHKASSKYGASDRFKTILNSATERMLDLCIDSLDNQNANRRDLRILERANNSTGVVLATMDELYDANDNPNGSQCFGR